MRALITYLLPLLLLVGCARPPQTPNASPSRQGPTAAPPPAQAPAAPPASSQAPWKKLLDDGSSDLFYVDPNGSGLIFGPSYSGNLNHVDLATNAVKELPTRNLSFSIGAMQSSVRIADTPYGPLLVGESPGNPRLSPDGKRLAFGWEGLWVADLESGELRRIGSEPEPPPRPLQKHELWGWADFPTWSADGGWIEFYSTRLGPGSYTRWRIPAAGGSEELVSKADAGPFGRALLTDGRVVRVEGSQIHIYPREGGAPQVVADGVPSPNSLSPDGRWVVALDREQPRLVIYDTTVGQQRDVPLPAGSGPILTDTWHGSRLLFNTRPASYDEPSFLSVLDAATGSLTHYTMPSPTQAYPYPLGWTAKGQPLARLLPDMDLPTGGTAVPDGVWLLEPSAYTPPATAAPAALRSARLVGPGPAWKQSLQTGAVTGGATEARSESQLLLQYDQPLDAAWIRQAVQVEGKAILEVHGGPLGLALVRVDGAGEGESIRVRVPAFGFDLVMTVVAADS